MTRTLDVLFVTLDSCRYDAFEQAHAPNLRALGPLVRAWSPSYFTYGAHASFFQGFTPGDPSRREPYVNPKYAKIFRMGSTSHPGAAPPYFALEGRSIVDGFNRLGYVTVGTGAVGWFDPATETGRQLSADFGRFRYPGRIGALREQRSWLLDEVRTARDRDAPVFAFLNVGETHVPYWHEGAPWPATFTCVPFAADNDAAESHRRQVACIEWIDAELAPLLKQFADAAIIVCSDHGDCWGEDGLWEHGVHHAKTLEVPLIYRLP
jgi:hypothetical protein